MVSPDLLIASRACERAPQRNLVFTSAGDRSNISRWLRGEKDFDLWITYYGDDAGVARGLSGFADCYNARKDSKFGNLKFAYDTWPDAFAQYEAVLVLDDDLLISGDAIGQLFETRKKLDLWLLQPAFSPLGKISWRVTQVQHQYVLRFTNFVEMSCPLFRRDKLDAFMTVFDPILSGEGTDWWYMEVLGPCIDRKVAVIDAIACVNPHDRTKGGVREIDRLEPLHQRKANWEAIKQLHGLSTRVHSESGKVLKPWPMRWLSPLLHVPIDAYVWARHIAWLVKRALTTRRPARQ